MPEALVAPIIAGVFVLVGIIVTVVMNNKAGKAHSIDSKGPSALEAWQESDRSRALSRLWEDAYYLLRSAFKAYARRMIDFSGEAAALTPKEREALESEPPSTDKPKEDHQQ